MSNHVHYNFPSQESNPNSFVEYPSPQTSSKVHYFRPLLAHHVNAYPPVDPVLLNNTVHLVRYAGPELSQTKDPVLMNKEAFGNHVKGSSMGQRINQVHVRPFANGELADSTQRNDRHHITSASAAEELQKETNIHFLPPEKVGPTVPCKFADVGCCAVGTPMEIELHCMKNVVLHQNLAYTGFLNATHQLEELKLEHASLQEKNDNASTETEQRDLKIENLERKCSGFKEEIKWLKTELQKKTDQHELTLRELRSMKKRGRDKTIQTQMSINTDLQTDADSTIQNVKSNSLNNVIYRVTREREEWDLDAVDEQPNVKTTHQIDACPKCATLQIRIEDLTKANKGFTATIKSKDNELAQLRQNYKAYKMECKNLGRQLANLGVVVPIFKPEDAPTDSVDSSELEEEYERLLVQYQQERDIYEKISDELFQAQNQLKQLNLNFTAANMENIVVTEPVQNAVNFKVSNAVTICDESLTLRKPYTLVSANCYSGKPGYKYQYRVCLEGYDLGFDFRVRKGAYDAFLKWPFEMGIHLTIFSDNDALQNEVISISCSEILLACRSRPTADATPPDLNTQI